MKRTLLCLLALLTACVLLAACSRHPENAGTVPEGPSVTEPAEPTPAPTPTPPPYEPNMLTGAARDADYAVNQRPLAVMINNITQARPQYGLSKADIITEIEVEGGITRLMAIFQNYKTVGEVGPIRSGRIQYFELIAPWEMIYLHDGENRETVTPLVRALDYGQWNIGGDDRKPENMGVSYRVNRTNWNGGSLESVHREFFSGDRLDAFLQKDGVDTMRNYNTGTFFYFMDYRMDDPVRDLGTGPDANYPPLVSDGVSYAIVDDAPYVEIIHNENRDFRTRFFYDPGTYRYNMEQWYAANYYGGNQWLRTMDAANNTQLSFTNVVVLFTQIDNYPGTVEKGGLKRVDYTSGGVGYYFYGGKRELIYWEKGNPQDYLRLFYCTENGKKSDELVPLNIGKTYLAIVDLDCFPWFASKSLVGASSGADQTPASRSNVSDYTVLNGMASPSESYTSGDDDAGDVIGGDTGVDAGTVNETPDATGVTDTGTASGEHEHTWDGGVLEQAWPCVPGTITYTCTAGDGATYTEEVPPSQDHSYDANGSCVVCTYYNPDYDTRTAPEEAG